MSAGGGNTIFALSSGTPPAAIAVVRISGPHAAPALEALTGLTIPPREPRLVKLSAHDELLDRALVLRFVGPNSATGDDLVELHLHGGRSVVAGVLGALADMEGLREAAPGEFTRRAFQNGRIDLAEAEGLSDLLAAETASQRRAALALAGGALSRQVEQWQQALLAIAASIETGLDFADEGDVEGSEGDWKMPAAALAAEISTWLARPSAERLKEGFRVVIAGPPNVGKSSLLNALVSREAAIVAPIAGTTRDVIEAPVAFDGVPFLLMDTAGLRESEDVVEEIGVGRARAAADAADLILWLGPAPDCPDRARSLILLPKSDIAPREAPEPHLRVSSVTGEGLDDLRHLLLSKARAALPASGEAALHARHLSILEQVTECLSRARREGDPILAAEEIRRALAWLDQVTGRAGTEEMLEAIFSRFCIGK